jgi:hypothetical protein
MGRNAQDALSTKVADWDLIEVDYRAGIKTLRQIADEHGITHGAVNKRAKTRGWTRDLTAKIQAAAEAKVSKAAVSSEVSAQRLATENQVVEANADVQFRIRMEHRQDIGRTRLLFRTMLEELEVASSTEGRALMAAMADASTLPGPDETEESRAARVAMMRRLLDKITSGPNRIDSAKKLTDVLEKVVKLEREAFGILPPAGNPEAAAPLAEALQAFVGSLHQAGSRLPIAKRP